MKRKRVKQKETMEESASKGDVESLKHRYYTGDFYNEPDNRVEICTNALSVAAKNGHLECVKFLCSIGAIASPSLVYDCVLREHRDCVKFFLSIGADIYEKMKK